MYVTSWRWRALCRVCGGSGGRQSVVALWNGTGKCLIQLSRPRMNVFRKQIEQPVLVVLGCVLWNILILNLGRVTWLYSPFWGGKSVLDDVTWLLYDACHLRHLWKKGRKSSKWAVMIRGNFSKKLCAVVIPRIPNSKCFKERKLIY